MFQADLMFEKDEGFWSLIEWMSAHSRVPVILTANGGLFYENHNLIFLPETFSVLRHF